MSKKIIFFKTKTEVNQDKVNQNKMSEEEFVKEFSRRWEAAKDSPPSKMPSHQPRGPHDRIVIFIPKTQSKPTASYHDDPGRPRAIPDTEDRRETIPKRAKERL